MQTFTGREYLQMDIASAFGYDDKPWADRLSWFKQNQEAIETCEGKQLNAFVRDADEPAQAFAGILAWRATLRGERTGYMCGLDATASGIQLLSLLAGCETSAKACNLIDVGTRVNAYTLTYSTMMQRLGTVGTLEPKPVKQALMTHMYASKAVPKQVFGEDTPELAMFYEVVEDLLPGANQLNHDLLSLWQGDALNYSWTLPDGFEVVIKVMGTVEHDIKFLERDYTVVQRINRPQEKGLSLGANVIHSIDGMVVREMARRCNYNPQKVERADYILRMNKDGIAAHRDQDFQLMRLLTLFEMTGFFSLAVIEYLDEENAGHLRDVHRAALAQVLLKLPVKPFPLVCVHDCFKFQANYGNDVRRQYIEILAELAESNTLSAVASDIAGRTITVKKISTRLPELIRESEYPIC